MKKTYICLEYYVMLVIYVFHLVTYIRDASTMYI